MSIFRIPATVLHRIDIIRRNFLWQGYGDNKRKYALLNWPTICMGKKHEGMSILNLNHMNIALLTKWLWELKNPSFQGLWKQAILVSSHTPPNVLVPLSELHTFFTTPP